LGASFTNCSRNTYPYSDCNCNGDTNANANAYANTNSHAYTYAHANAHSYSFSDGYRDALSSNRSGLCRRENFKRTDHLAERRVQYERNHKSAARAHN